MTNYIGENVRYLLWKHRIRHASWTKELAEMAGCGLSRADELIRGEDTGADALELVATAFGIAGEELLGRLLDPGRVDILRENVAYLLGGLAHGEHKQLAAHLGVHPTTVSRWSGGVQRPPVEKRRSLCGYFGLAAGTDLALEPLFLNPTPVGEQAMRERLEVSLRQLPVRTLRELYPALERLLRER